MVNCLDLTYNQNIELIAYMITALDIIMCEEFAHKYLEASKDFYKSRGQTTSKVFDQIVQGKLAEVFVCRYLSNLNYFPSTPDFKIHSTKNKNYDSDLYLAFKDTHLHVKSCSIETANKLGWGWVMQKNDPIVKNPKKNHFLVLVEVHTGNIFKIHHIINSLDAVYKPTKYNLPSKCVIYGDDILSV